MSLIDPTTEFFRGAAVASNSSSGVIRNAINSARCMLGLPVNEIAAEEAPATNESSVDVMSNDKLKRYSQSGLLDVAFEGKSK